MFALAQIRNPDFRFKQWSGKTSSPCFQHANDLKTGMGKVAFTHITICLVILGSQPLPLG
ncbi:hypothetical protein DPMN_150847 [Dreissena polymorpha]|uniref:Uncharacterized protein n=1 Tax=Dreissena polymorpha TaxID=45954 RepID=A0A9D4J3Q2_DREPO|nr:hypothetical protein DPMN_150847 [Dreissena polymorpha]